MPCWRSEISAPHFWHVGAGVVWSGAVLRGELSDVVIVADMGLLKTSSRRHKEVGRSFLLFVKISRMRSLREIRCSVRRLE